MGIAKCTSYIFSQGATNVTRNLVLKTIILICNSQRPDSVIGRENKFLQGYWPFYAVFYISFDVEAGRSWQSSSIELKSGRGLEYLFCNYAVNRA